MKLPWISRFSHDEMMSLVTAQLGELKAERLILLDRLASLGLGGPLFASPAQPGEEADEEAAALKAQDEAQDLEQLMMSWRRRPSKLADALTSKARRDQARVQTGPSVKWIPRVDTVNAALDEAEAIGKTQA